MIWLLYYWQSLSKLKIGGIKFIGSVRGHMHSVVFFNLNVRGKVLERISRQ